MTNAIHQEVLFDATPERIYAALTDPARFSAMCGGAPTDIDASAGGAFSCFGGMITGRNIECTKGERLVQAWRAKPWPEGHYSLVHFRMQAEAKGTRLVLDHVGFPEGQSEHLGQGWEKNYWEPLRVALAE